jgi:beta-fructofuranosidase
METTTNALQRANDYIEAHIQAVNPTFRHHLHLMPPIGWMNDPNGFCVYQGEYHLFYQYYPYATSWGPMHWGHAKSKDLLTWENLPVALAPSEPYDASGIFSGCALAVGEELWLYYTGLSDTGMFCRFDENLLKRAAPLELADGQPGITRQVQCLAVSKDGIHFAKSDLNPVIGSDQVPDHSRVEDFRDPKVWTHGGKYYMACGSMSKDTIGEVLFYVSADGLDWQYLNRLILDGDFGIAWECPDLFELEGKHVLIFSPVLKPRQGCSFENTHSSIAMIGHFDHDLGVFSTENIQELDQGFDFYAPQTIVGLDGSRVMLAWMNMWEHDYVLDRESHGWNGSMTLPRRLTLQGNQLIQWPIDALAAYHRDEFVLNEACVEGEWSCPELAGNRMDLDLAVEILSGSRLTISFFTGSEEGLILEFDKTRNLVLLNRMSSHRPIRNLNEKSDFYRCFNLDCSGTIKLRAILDVCSLELFFNEGQVAMTSLFFPDANSQQLVFKTEGKAMIHQLTRWTLDRTSDLFKS